MSAIPPEQKIVDQDQSVAACLIQLQDLDVKCDLARIELEAANPVAERLQAARDQLVALQSRYTDAHPAVQDQKETIKALEQEWAGQSRAPLVNSNGVVAPLINKQNKALARQLEEFENLRGRVKARLAGLSNTNLNFALLKNRLDVLQQMRTTLASRQREAEVFAADASGYYQGVSSGGVVGRHPQDQLEEGISGRGGWRIVRGGGSNGVADVGGGG